MFVYLGVPSAETQRGIIADRGPFLSRDAMQAHAGSSRPDASIPPQKPEPHSHSMVAGGLLVMS